MKAILVIDPNNIKALKEKAEILASREDWAGAEQSVAKIKEIEPESTDGYHQMGMIFQMQEKHDQAIEEFEKALVKSKQSFESLAAMAKSYVAQGKYDRAIDRVKLGLQVSPNNLDLALLLGQVYAHQKRFSEAESAFRKVIQINAKLPEAYMYLSEMYLARNDAKSAFQIVQQGLVAIPAELNLSNLLADIYLRTGNVDKAIDQYELILKSNPKADMIAINLASLLTDARGDKSSLNRALDLVKHFENATSLPVATDTLGWIYYKLGQNDKAVSLLKMAVEKDPYALNVHYHLGMALYKKGDKIGAKRHLKMAVDSKVLYPGWNEAKATLDKL